MTVEWSELDQLKTRLRSMEEQIRRKSNEVGAQAGRRWAGDSASLKQLRILADVNEQCKGNWKCVLDSYAVEGRKLRIGPNLGLSIGICQLLHPQMVVQPVAFWRDVCNGGDMCEFVLTDVVNAEFALGFVEGALSLWKEVAA